MILCKSTITGLVLGFCTLISGCGGSSSGSSASGTAACTGSCATASSFLTTADVEQIIAQAVNEANARGLRATIAVVDRVGNVLGVFRMNGAAMAVTIDSGRGVIGGLENISIIPDTLAAISKAITGAYLSSEGNAFTTRTAGQIIQQHFNPQEFGQPGGPLFGVQFSQLPCSDFSRRFVASADAGPKRSPLGLAADPGGIPVYKAGTPVGAVGVIADSLYGIDLTISDIDTDVDERIALAGSAGFQAPADLRANRITVDGKLLRFTDGDALLSNPATAPAFSTIDKGVTGSLLAVKGYSTASTIAGTAFGQAASGIRADALDYPGLDAFVLVDNTDTERYRPKAGTDGLLMTAEVREIMRSALALANRARAQIRRPLGSQARVSISVVDTNGEILALARTRDAPVFGTDVALQKARTAAFFSNPSAAADLGGPPPAKYFDSGTSSSIGDYVTALRTFLADPAALANGTAFSDRAGGNLSRPFFPDGINGNTHGPLGKPFASWSPFSTGLQLDLVNNAIIAHVAFVAGLSLVDTGLNCTTLPRLANGIQIFPGSVPIFRGNVLVGGMGVSGDGIDQDDLISFLGLHIAGLTLSTGIGNAPVLTRADQISVPGFGVNLRYVQCPQTPFLDSSEQNVCDGI